MPTVACVGLSCRDHVWHVERFPPTGSRTHADAYRAEGGGPAATAAVAASRLGAHARLWAVHGDDDEGRANTAELRTHGVDLAGSATPIGSRSFVSAVLIDRSGERFIFPYRGHALADDPDGHDWSGLDGVGAVLVDGRHPRLAAHALGWAATHAVPSVGDWSDGRHPDLRARVDHLVVSEEAGRLALAEAGTEGLDDPLAMAATATRELRGRPGQLVAVTLGPLGCVWDDGRDTWWQSAPQVEVVDSNGAGDAFHGAYTFAVAAGAAPSLAFRLATAVGALRCCGEGRAALPALQPASDLADSLPPARHLGRSRAPLGGHA